jgi:acyl-CoA synthetase (AMP-forming)/AMP-acid ligase II
VQVLKDENITGLAGVPQIWAYLVRSTLADVDLPHLRYITNSGGPVPTRVLELLKKAVPGTDIFLMYGLTEAFRSTYLKPDELDAHPQSIGKAIPNSEILVVSDDGKLCGPDEIGEIVHRGPTVALGYWGLPDKTAERYRTVSLPGINNGIPEGMVFSGDLGKYDEQGFLYCVGREDMMLKCSGIRVSPSEVEEIVFQSGLVKETAVIGIPDEIAGHLIKAFIVPVSQDPSEYEDIEDRILELCSTRLPNYMIPRHMESVPVLPKTPHGKIDYTELKNRDHA